MSIVSIRKFAYAFSAVLLVASLGALWVKGLNLGVDFTGDARIEVEYQNTLSANDARSALESAGISVLDIEARGDRTFDIRTSFLSEEDHQKALTALRSKGELAEKSFQSTGPSVGRQLRRNAILAISITMIAIVLYIAWAFRKVSKPVSSWVYGLIAIVALFHDVVIPAGIFSYFGIEIDALFVTALLTVLGFSVHDTIVVFDRVRENLRKSQGGPFHEIVDRSLRETIGRSINTSLTTVLSLVAIYFFGGVSTQSFSLALILGIIIGTYSSVFIATPLLVTVERWKRTR